MLMRNEEVRSEQLIEEREWKKCDGALCTGSCQKGTLSRFPRPHRHRNGSVLREAQE